MISSWLMYNEQRQNRFILLNLKHLKIDLCSYHRGFLPVVNKGHSVGGSHTRRDSCISEELDPL